MTNCQMITYRYGPDVLGQKVGTTVSYFQYDALESVCQLTESVSARIMFSDVAVSISISEPDSEVATFTDSLSILHG